MHKTGYLFTIVKEKGDVANETQKSYRSCPMDGGN
jgi:hypothetical protein